MRICIFVHRFDDGGAEKTTIRLANEMAALGHEMTLAVRYDYGPLRSMAADNVCILDMKLPENGKLRKNIKNVAILRKIINSGEYDILMAVLAEMAEVAAVAHALGGKGTPLVCVLHSTLSVEKTSFHRIRHSFHRFFDRQYAGVIAVSEAVRKDYIKNCKAAEDKVVTIYNPLIDQNIALLAAKRPDHPWLSEKRRFKTLLMVGRLSYPKNHELMFKTLKLLLMDGDFRLILLGDGERKAELEGMAKEMGLKANIDFAGYRDNPFGYMAFCDCLVLSSHYEGLPSVLVEGLACGCRIVSVDCPSGPAEILEGGRYGVLVPPEDAQALKDGIIRALKDTPCRETLIRRAKDFSVSGAVQAYERELGKIADNFRRQEK